MAPATNNQPGVTVTLREIYDATLAAAAAGTGARDDVALLRKDVQVLASRVSAVERQVKDTQTPAYLKRLGYAVGIIAAGVAAGWGAIHGAG